MRMIKFLVISVFVFFTITTSDVRAATYYFHTDHLGTPQVLTDENQQVVWQGDQEPFGENNPTVSSIEQNFRFPGQYLDVETGLHYNYFRTYEPAIGRYTQSDPIGIEGGMGVYVYALNNSVLRIDPYGDISTIKQCLQNPTMFQTCVAANLITPQQAIKAIKGGIKATKRDIAKCKSKNEKKKLQERLKQLQNQQNKLLTRPRKDKTSTHSDGKPPPSRKK